MIKLSAMLPVFLIVFVGDADSKSLRKMYTEEMSLQDELTETTVIDKLRRLLTFFTDKQFEDIDRSFDLEEDVTADRDYFLTMMAGALTFHFGVDAEFDTIAPFKTLGDLADFVTEEQKREE